MHIESYDYISGQNLGAPESLSFGDIVQDQHSVKPLIIKFVADSKDSTAITNVKLFLENKGQWVDAEYSYYHASIFTRIESGSHLFTPFVNVPVSLNWDGTSTDYLWLTAKIGKSEGLCELNFRLSYDIP